MAAIKVNVTLPEELLQRIDAFAEENAMTRSGLLAISARQYLDAAMLTPDMKKLMQGLSGLVSNVVDGKISVEDANTQLNGLEKSYDEIRGQCSFDVLQK